MLPTKTIHPLEKHESNTKPKLINIRQHVAVEETQNVSIMSPDELDKASRQSSQAANALIADSMLDELNRKERDKLIANTIASEVGDIQTTSFYEVQVADQIGFPYFKFFFISIIVGIVGLKFNWLNSLYSIISYLGSIYFAYLWLRHWRGLRKRK